MLTSLVVERFSHPIYWSHKWKRRITAQKKRQMENVEHGLTKKAKRYRLLGQDPNSTFSQYLVTVPQLLISPFLCYIIFTNNPHLVLIKWQTSKESSRARRRASLYLRGSFNPSCQWRKEDKPHLFFFRLHFNLLLLNWSAALHHNEPDSMAKKPPQT